jgi:glycosyltransferase involved in cell wall biosynthesis
VGAAAAYVLGGGGFIVKIAQLLTASTGGIGRHVASIAPRLEQRGHQIRVFCPKVTAEAQHFKELGLDVWPLGSPRRFIGADLVHAHGLKAGWLGLPIAWMYRIPLVVTWHNAVLGDGLAPSAARQMQRTVALGADLTLGASRDLVALARRLGARNARFSPVAAPVVPPAGTSRGDQRWVLGAADEDTVILTVSRLAPQKNLGMVLDIAAAVRDRHDLRFVIVGDGPERDKLQRRITNEWLQVRLLGGSDDMGSLLAAADLALLTSTWEARALVAQEALLAGLPLISTRVGGIEELVGSAAVLVASGDVEEAARQIVALADSPAERLRLREAGLRQAATWPNEDGVADDLAEVYNELTRGRRYKGFWDESGGFTVR